MFDLYLPYAIGLALGLAPDDQGAVPAAVAETATVAATTTSDGRTPEEQVSTGKFMTALEVKPILGATQGNWVAVRDYNGQDLLYFTHLMSWRCGLWDVHYGINGAPATEMVPMEPCHTETATPNAMTQIEDYLPYVALPPGSVDSVTVSITYDDGTTDTASFERTAILIP